MQKLLVQVEKFRDGLSDAYWQLRLSPFGTLVPTPQVAAGVLTGALIALTQNVTALNLPAGWAEVAGAFIVSWLVGPEPEVPPGAGILVLEPGVGEPDGLVFNDELPEVEGEFVGQEDDPAEPGKIT